ncbi:GDSL esterase/lipase At1g28650-like [Magnolia sinica]|uniref:GDSL esterase/lipase At1g28650-like n=1 Tax=Magnolia sinica TaxID=86752 RepID=UPI0026588395|nr:GDSL esterase/lipase At1g28650-like [Magnolia sinica]
MAAPSNQFLSLILFTFSVIFLLNLPCAAAQALDCNFQAIYNFGDSISDTGNLIREDNLGTFEPITKLPYGETYFHQPTGRCSNGLLMVDFFARWLELPFINPNLQSDASFGNGVNFAVAGATALQPSFWLNHGVQTLNTNSSLEVQLNWFKAYLHSVCFSQIVCENELLEKALFLVGEIGGNDYNYAFIQGKSIEEVTTFVPNVVHKIKDVASQLIDAGAVHLVIPGNFPIGCIPIYLTIFHSDDPSSYDENNCLRYFNDFAMSHNRQLQQAIQELKEEFPHVLIAYADYYNTLMGIIKDASDKGFESDSLLKACCGIGGAYNFNLVSMCGMQGVPVCPNPEKYIHWDGVHLTQEAYGQMASSLISSVAGQWKCLA